MGIKRIRVKTAARSITVSLVLTIGLVLQPASVSAACTAQYEGFGKVTGTFDIPSAGTYTVWSRLSSRTAGSDSFILDIDGSQCGIIVGDSPSIPLNTWTWVNYQGGVTTNVVTAQFSTTGQHSYTIYGREDNVAIDRLIFSNITNCIPSGDGALCIPSSSPAPSTTTIENTNTSVAYSGTWSTSANAGASGGSTTSTSINGANMGAVFTGISLSIYGTKTSGSGKIMISLDGISQATIDLYNASTQTQQMLWSRSGLANSPHALVITKISGKNTASTGEVVNIDKIDISGSATGTAPTFNSGCSTIILTSSKSADICVDGTIGIKDLRTLARNYGLGGKNRFEGDLNGDTTVNIADLRLLARNYGQ